MKTRNAFTDDHGQEWEFLYDERYHYEERDGRMVALPSTVADFTYRKVGDPEWLSLPPWADVAEQRKITLGFFDEDEETGEYTFWELEPPAVAERADA